MKTWQVSKLECGIIGLVAGMTCPVVTFVAFWWTAAALHLYVHPMPEGMIIAAALTGLGLGGLLDLLFLRRWVRNFFTASLWWVAAIYLCLCFVAVGLFMGVPAGTFSLGVVAGVYMGRRQHHGQADEARAAAACRRVAVFAAFVTVAAALPIGILALRSEQQILRMLEAAFRLGRNSLEGQGGLGLVGFLCLFLFVTQYGCTRMAGRLAFRIHTAPFPASV
jgi:hypothetical protein